MPLAVYLGLEQDVAVATALGVLLLGLSLAVMILLRWILKERG